MKLPSSKNDSLLNIIKKNLSITSNPNDTIQDVRLRLLHWILIAINILGIPIVVIGIIEALLLNQHLTAFSYLICYTPILLALILRTKISYNICVSMVLVSLYLIGIFNLIFYGFSGASTPIFFTLLVFTTVFFDIRAGLKAVLFCLLPMLIIGLFYIQNKLSLDISLQEINTYPISWFTASTVFVFLGILIIMSFGIIQKKMFQSMQFSKQKADELKKLNLQLYKSEEKFRILYNNSPDMYISVSPDDANILLCNDTLLSKTGYSKDEVIGSSIFKMYHEDCIDDVNIAFKQFAATGMIKGKELILKRKDGCKIEVSLNVESVRDESGKILHSISSWRDITERKLAEAELEKHREHLEELVKNRTAELEEKNKKLEEFNELFVDREFRIKELKDKVKELEKTEEDT